MNTTHSTKKKLLAQALGIAAAAVLGVLSNGGTAAADGHNVVDPEATWGAADGAEQRGVDIVPAVQSNDTSSTVPGTTLRSRRTRRARPTFRSRRTRRTRLGRGADGALRTADGRYGSRRRETRYWLLPTRMSVPPAGLGS